MGSSIITYGTLFDDQSRNPRKFGDFPLSNADRSRKLISRHVEAPCESGYPSIANVPFDLVREERRNNCEETYDLSCRRSFVVNTSRGATAVHSPGMPEDLNAR